MYLGESLHYVDWVALVVAFVGILMIQNPYQEHLV
jgi:drug/metabolite transporter (DMT)-like permease